MLRRTTRQTPPVYICSACRRDLQLRLQERRFGPSWTSRAENGRPSLLPYRRQHTRRMFHTLKPRHSSVAPSPNTTQPDTDPLTNPSIPRILSIREHLQAWQDRFGSTTDARQTAALDRPSLLRDVSNDVFSRLPPRESRSDGEEELDQESDWWIEANPDLNTVVLFYLKPGDVVEVVRGSLESHLAAYIKTSDSGDGIFLLQNGRLLRSPMTRIHFVIPQYIHRDLVQPMGSYLPTAFDPAQLPTVPRHLSKDVMEILQGLSKEYEAVYRQNSLVLDRAHSLLADDTQPREMTLTEIGDVLLGKDDPGWSSSTASVLAVRKAVSRDQLQFLSLHKTARMTHTVTVTPKQTLNKIGRVQNWIRTYAHYLAMHAAGPGDSLRGRTSLPDPASPGATVIAGFLEKARRLISISRGLREHTIDGQLPSKLRSSPGIREEFGEKFSPEEQDIIDVLMACYLHVSFEGRSDLLSACRQLLNWTRYYQASSELDYDVRRGSGLLFLQELGIITPFENRYLYGATLELPDVRRSLTPCERVVEKHEACPELRDSMADLRYDWGPMNVYCIDSADAEEIDDGISISKVDGKEDQRWVHIHIANPTAFFDKRSPLGAVAAQRIESIYVPERTYPMLPRWASQNRFSLAPNRPVLTFSARLDGTGSVLETQVRNGIVRKVISLQPDDVPLVLGSVSEPAKIQRITVGGRAPALPEASQKTAKKWSSVQVQELRDLCEYARLRHAYRLSKDGIVFSLPTKEARVFEHEGQTHSGLIWRPPSTKRARFVHGDPIIDVAVEQMAGEYTTAWDERNVTAEMMIVAGEVAARWCTERDIPAVFRGTVYTPGDAAVVADQQRRREAVRALLAAHGSVSYHAQAQIRANFGRGLAHPRAIPHPVIGIEQYVKVTSPLRRYADMMTHWQIEAALRREAATGKKFATDEEDRGVLPFSEQQIEDAIAVLLPRENAHTAIKLTSFKFWATLALHRGFHSNDGGIPETWRAIYKKDPWGLHADSPWAQASLMGVELACLLKRQAGDEYRQGDEWEVKLVDVNLFTGELLVEPIRLVRREELSLPGLSL